MKPLGLTAPDRGPGRPGSPASGALTRRAFLQSGVAGLSAWSVGRVLGANERVGVGIIGFGLIGRIHARSFLEQPDVNIVGVAETYQPRLEAAAQLVGGNVATYRDFRRLLERKDVDAVVVATPDHSRRRARYSQRRGRHPNL